MVDILVSVLIITGAVFALIGSLGLARLPDFFTRLHGPTKATTLGVGAMLLGSVVFFTAHTGILSVSEFLIALFLAFTAPVSAYLMAHSALHRGKNREMGDSDELARQKSD